ncbi:thioredoxin domain-containing protein [Patescibacteria group bacterium]|nr:thioredoxin domain-containing protein [Patescibacteria group bacterium]
MMHRTRLILLVSIIGLFILLTGWLVWREVDLRMNSFVAGAPPENLREVLLPQTIDINLMRPPALRPIDPVRYGDINSQMSVIEFGDYECEACRANATAIRNVLPEFDGKVRFVWRDMPVTESHPHAMNAAIFARCAGYQGRYWEAHDALLSAAALSSSAIDALAKRLDVNLTALGTCRNDGEVRRIIEEDITAGRADGVNSVPLLFIGTKAYSGTLTEAQLREAIRSFLES